MKKIELLAPAGNFEALKAAVEAGADAVYLAGDHFGARAYAGNFSNDDLMKAVEFAHLRGVAIHVTVNTIVCDEEFDQLKDYLKFLNKINVDAVLIQDLGVASIAKQVAPELILHASTQMTVHNLEGVKALENFGFKRIVLARELSIEEIKNICANTSVEIEIFMHGALCVCYSGQCLMSSMIGARSGNRGQCAQPCRLPYELVDVNGNDLLSDQAGKYLLSPKDLNTIEILPQLINVGVSSLKIEGRMKRPEYVAIVVETYRKAIDRCLKNISDYEVTAEEQRNLAQIFNRDFTTAYLEKIPGKNMISDKRPNNRGLLIGRVLKVDKEQLKFRIPNSEFRINKNDQIEIWIKVGGRVTITIKDFTIDGDICTIKTTENLHGVKIHDRVFKIFDAELTNHARKFFTSAAPIRRIDIDVEIVAKLNEPLRMKIIDTDQNVAEVESKILIAKAEGKPLDSELIKKQISRLGNTIFNLCNFTADIEENLMIPISELNDLRRRAVEILNSLRLKSFNRISKSEPVNNQFCILNSAFYIKLSVHVDSIDRLKAAIYSEVDEILFGGENYNHENISPSTYQKAIDLAHSANKKIFIATPRIVREVDQPLIEEILRSIYNADGVYIHNLAMLNLARRLTNNLPIFADYSLIVFNSETINFLNHCGVEGVTLSPELTLEQIKSLVKKSSLPVECIIHGRTELMISSYCTIGSFLGGVGDHKCSMPCKRQKFFLRDRKSEIFPIMTDQFCRMHILNSKILSMLPHVNEFKKSGVSKIRIDGRSMTLDELKMTIKNYRLAMNGESINEGDNITRGHYFRGVNSKTI